MNLKRVENKEKQYQLQIENVKVECKYNNTKTIDECMLNILKQKYLKS